MEESFEVQNTCYFLKKGVRDQLQRGDVTGVPIVR